MSISSTITEANGRYIIETEDLRTVFGSSLAAAEMISLLQQEVITIRRACTKVSRELRNINVECEECGFVYHHQHYEEDKPCPVCQEADHAHEIRKLSLLLREVADCASTDRREGAPYQTIQMSCPLYEELREYATSQ